MSYNLHVETKRPGDSTFGLGSETISPYSHSFEPNDQIKLVASQKYYSFNYYEIHSPITIARSDLSYITYNGFTASFDPRTDVYMNVNADVTGSNSLIIAHYR
jgi:hypothetical protein